VRGIGASLALLGAVALLMAGRVRAQEVVGGWWAQTFRWDHSVILNYQDGGDVTYVDDIDGDGWVDMVLGEGEQHGYGSMMAVSGRTGAILWFRVAPDLGSNRLLDGFASRIQLATIDLLGGGLRDLVLSSMTEPPNDRGVVLMARSDDPDRPWVMLEDPGNPPGLGLPEWTRFGVGFQSSNVVTLPDTDGDGYPDVLVGAIGASQVANELDRGAVFAHTRAYGVPRTWRLDGSEEFGFFGATLAEVGDFTGDGNSEVAIGEPGSDVGAYYAGAIHIYDPYAGVMLASFYGALPYDSYGALLEPLGDVNGDSVPDLLTGQEWGGLGGGYVRALSGADGSELWTVMGPVLDQRYGHRADASQDLDGDGIQDVVLSVRDPVPGARSRVEVLSGATGERLWLFEPEDKDTSIAHHLAVWADLRGGNAPRILFQSYNSIGLYRNWAEEFVFDPFLWPGRRILRASQGGQVKYALDFPDAEAGAAYQLLASRSGRGPTILQGLEVPLTRDALFQRSLQGPLPWTAGASGVLDAFGDATASFTPPAGALSSWVGRTLWTAAVSYRSSGPGLSSVAVPLHVLP